uniref:Damage-control phosphatase ARMT1-like metal-binding domain-containing protein n=1 Tax=Candidatus Kentrum eta TaxID=2126337 RepID=A0A450UIG8_9GAMM|nr:MAG: hypothetical protein BECKH772A_GA0070896_1003713 [Candidatus Kentron sp. H]VFJ92297.1 MAG: hypothetical protein BECKH772B_GA0070898_1002720 [Candidatus Kentron sp. H]VFK01429.1 MAG: hypothetical protein BECKH772C_GA0070978_100662 [Candidatus Kentron sp. H]
MKNDIECYPCLLRQTVETSKIATDDGNIHREIVQEVIEGTGIFQKDRIPIVVGKEIQSIVRRLANNPDPYRDIKREYNRKARDLIPLVEEEIARSPNKLATALKIITIANIIDFAALEANQIDLAGFLHAKLPSDFRGSVRLEQFIRSLHEADSILYVVDNCGEIILDCHFINRFLADKSVYLSVRGAAVLNDATREDLEGVSLHENVTIMDTGDDSPGVILKTSSDAFNQVYKEADLVILKGQGNFEGISAGAPGRGDVYSLLVTKCPVVARHIGCEINDLVLTTPG